MDRQEVQKMNDYWMEGDIARLSETVGMHISSISAILHRRRRVSVMKAVHLQDAAKEVGYDIPWQEWIRNDVSTHRAFFGDPIQG